MWCVGMVMAKGGDGVDTDEGKKGSGDSVEGCNCPSGRYCDADNVCEDCWQNQYSNANTNECIDCPQNTFSASGDANCTACPANTYRSSGVSEEDQDCQHCKAGRYNTGSSCHNCHLGWYSPYDNATECLECPLGQITDGCAQCTHCSNCSVNTYAELGFSGTFYHCKDCPEGKFQPLEGQTECRTCELGEQFKNDTLECIPCASGMYGDRINCHVCPPGTFSNHTGSASCTDCSPGHYQHVANQTSCLPCDHGQYQSNSSSTQCIPFNCVQAGVYKPSQVNTALVEPDCLNCPSGKYKEDNNANCEMCSPSKYQDEEGQSSCKECEPGQFQDSVGQSSCTPCPGSTFTALYGQQHCTAHTLCNYLAQGNKPARSGYGAVPGKEGTSTADRVCEECKPSYDNNAIATFNEYTDQNYCVGYANDCGEGVLHKHGTPSSQRQCRFVNTDTCPAGFAQVSGVVSTGYVVCKRNEYLCPIQ